MAFTVNIQAAVDEALVAQLGAAHLDNARLRLALDEALTSWRREIDELIDGASRPRLLARIAELRKLLDSAPDIHAPAPMHPAIARGAAFKVPVTEAEREAHVKAQRPGPFGVEPQPLARARQATPPWGWDSPAGASVPLRGAPGKAPPIAFDVVAPGMFEVTGNPLTEIPPGLYELRFKDGTRSLAAVGAYPDGERWFAPCDPECLTSIGSVVHQRWDLVAGAIAIRLASELTSSSSPVCERCDADGYPRCMCDVERA